MKAEIARIMGADGVEELKRIICATFLLNSLINIVVDGGVTK